MEHFKNYLNNNFNGSKTELPVEKIAKEIGH